MTQLYFFIGLLGLAGMTWLCPLLGLFYKTSGRTSEPNWPPRSLEILIPAHNEESFLGRTLEEIKSQINDCLKKNTTASITLRVGADACSDQTAQISEQLEVPTNVFTFKSKWKTLCAMISNSRADWVGLVDAETLWPDDFLKNLWDSRWNSPLLGIAPAFGHGLVWSIERHFKVLETFSGGPVSVHGATVFYERVALQEALKILEAQALKVTDQKVQWINDDVVIPLTLRSRFPDRTLAYYSNPNQGSVTEQPRENKDRSSRWTLREEFKSSLRKRRRMMAGNLQWIKGLLPLVAAQTPFVALIAMRRVMRLFWAYWILFLILGLPQYFWYSLILFALLLRRKSVFAAFLASLIAPWQLGKKTDVSWN